MKLLSYQAKHFSWEAFSQTIPDADPQSNGAVDDAAVVWMHVEWGDMEDRNRVFKHALKQIKWVANKKELKTVVLHSFAHLGGRPADADFARSIIQDLATRLRDTGYTVHTTPFGWFCAWNLDVYGNSMAKVFKHIVPKTAST